MIKIPEKYREILAEAKDGLGFMGLSVGKKIFEDKKIMRGYSRFLADTFAKSFFLVADLPKRYNIMAIENISEQEALTRVMKAGYNLRVFLEKITRDMPNVNVKNYSELQSPAYYENLRILEKAYKLNVQFKMECDADVRNFLSIDRNKEKLNGRNFEKALETAVKYRIDELAILLAIPCGCNKICEVYPGKDALHEKLRKGKFDFCSELNIGNNRNFIGAYYGN